MRPCVIENNYYFPFSKKKNYETYNEFICSYLIIFLIIIVYFTYYYFGGVYVIQQQQQQQPGYNKQILSFLDMMEFIHIVQFRLFIKLICILRKEWFLNYCRHRRRQFVSNCPNTIAQHCFSSPSSSPLIWLVKWNCLHHINYNMSHKLAQFFPDRSKPDNFFKNPNFFENRIKVKENQKTTRNAFKYNWIFTN